MKTKTERVALLQLPVPGLEWRRRTGNIPLAGACLKEAVADFEVPNVHIIPQSTVSYLGDEALLRKIELLCPDLLGFSVYCWNVDRSVYIAEELKRRMRLQTLAGGPEITPDKDRMRLRAFDYLVRGEGEAAFRALLCGKTLGDAPSREGEIFKMSRSPYMAGNLEPELEDIVLLETQRGCPHKCAYCYYNTSHTRCVAAARDVVVEGVRWALRRGVSELYLLDPCLDAHPDLKALLKSVAQINSDGRLHITSEIRAESVDDEIADLFEACNFKSFEIGLQSTNPKSLSMMRRRTDLSKFVSGLERLKKKGIATRIDLIAGLPGDDLVSFKRSVDFVVSHSLHTDIQVFPLSLLPGTEFRRRHKELGIKFSEEPPYLVKEVPGFPEEDLFEAFSYAEERFGINLNPMPFLDIPYRRDVCPGGVETFDDITDGPYVCRVLISGPRSDESLEDTAARLTFPYQIVFLENAFGKESAARVIKILSSRNPFTPFEIVLHGAWGLDSADALLEFAELRRPHYMDVDLRYMFPRPGNRAVMITVVSRKRGRLLQGEMMRQVYWWRGADLPDRGALDSLMELDGVMIDPIRVSSDACKKWQDSFCASSDDLPAISFCHVELQKRWLRLTIPNQLCRGALFGED